MHRNRTTMIGMMGFWLMAIVRTALGQGDLRLELICPVKEIVVGEPLRLFITVTNESGTDIALPHEGCWGHDERFKLTLRHRTGSSDWNPFVNHGDAIGEVGVVIKPGRKYQIEVPMGWGSAFLEPYTYEFEATLRSSGIYYGRLHPRSDPRPCWKGEVKSNAVLLKVVHPLNAQNDEATTILAGKDEDSGKFYRLFEHGPAWVVSGEDDRFLRVLEKCPESDYAKDCEYYLGRAYAKCWLKRAPEDYFTKASKYLEGSIARDGFQFRPDAQLLLAQCLLKRDEDQKERAMALLKEASESKSQPLAAEAAKALLQELERRAESPNQQAPAK